MLDTRTNEWLSRLQSNGPNLVSLSLAVLIAVELARMAVSVLSGPVKSPQPTLARSAQTRPHPTVNVQAVVSAHLFGLATADPATQDPANAPLSSANLVLAGTIATQDPKHGIAIISDGGPSKVYSVGDNVNGASLYSVYLDHVILDRGGTLETLVLPRQLPGGPEPSLGPPAWARTSAPWRRWTTYAAWCSKIRGFSIRSCARSHPTTTRRGNCAAFGPIRAEIAPFSVNWA